MFRRIESGNVLGNDPAIFFFASSPPSKSIGVLFFRSCWKNRHLSRDQECCFVIDRKERLSRTRSDTKHSHRGVFSSDAIRVSGFVKRNPYSHSLLSSLLFKEQDARVVRLGWGSYSFCPCSNTYKRILGKSIEHCGSEACVRTHHANERLERRERFVFLINESFQAENKRDKNWAFFFFCEDRKSYYVVNMILDMYLYIKRFFSFNLFSEVAPD